MTRTQRRQRQRIVTHQFPAATLPRPKSAITHFWWAVVGLVVAAALTAAWALAPARPPVTFGYQVVNTFPHDEQAYTQGLLIDGGVLYEGTGKYGESTLRQVDLETGRVIQSQALDRDLFGEGIASANGRIHQLTWRNKVALVYESKNLQLLGRLPYSGEGWGLTYDGTHLIMSDGSATLRFLDPRTFRVVRRLLVRSQGRLVSQLNELEYVQGEVFANIWYKDYIARIDPRTGEVTGWIDLRNLWAERTDRERVLNGIAYDAAKDRLFVTGKNWPNLYEIRLVRP